MAFHISQLAEAIRIYRKIFFRNSGMFACAFIFNVAKNVSSSLLGFSRNINEMGV